MQHIKIRYLLGLSLSLLLVFVPSIVALNVAGQTNNPSVQAAPLLNQSGLPSVSFTSSSYSRLESAGSVSIGVEISEAPPSTVTVEYLTVDGTAIDGVDYIGVSGVMTFTTAGPTSQSFTIQIIDDNLFEPTETVNLILRNPVNATLGNPATAVLNITNDDPAPTNTPTATSGAPPHLFRYLRTK